jgi:hypothetical protein
MYTVRDVRGLGIMMLTLDTTSLYVEDRGIQVPMTLKHGQNGGGLSFVTNCLVDPTGR